MVPCNKTMMETDFEKMMYIFEGLDDFFCIPLDSSNLYVMNTDSMVAQGKT